MKLRDVIETLPEYQCITVSEDTSMEELNRIVRSNPGVRSIYVTDKEGKVLGEVSIGSLIKGISAKRRCGTRLSTRELISCLTCSRAGDLVDRRLVFATLDEDVEDVLTRALKYNIKEMPVLDERGHLVKNIGVLNLIALLEEDEKDD